MAKTATNIVERAMTLLDEQVTEFATAATTETSLKDIGLELLPDVCRNLVKSLPYELKQYLQEEGSLAAETLSDGEDQSSYTKQKVAFVSPTNFWELVSMRLSVWAKNVTDYILIDSVEYKRQNNPFTRSGKQNPKIAISQQKTIGGRRIECFSINDGDSVVVSSFFYVSFDNVPDDSGNTWPDELFELTTKALASELMLVKKRLEEGSISGSEGEKIIEQHK